MSARPKTEHPCADCSALFVGTVPAKWCPSCRWRHRGRKPKKYVFSDDVDERIRKTYDGRVRGRAAAIGKALGWPSWQVKKRAGLLGLTHPVNRKAWTTDDEAFLLDHCGSRHVHWIASKLGRSLASVVMKIKHLKISRRFREGYTLRELELCFGVDHRVIQGWAKDGKLEAGRRGTQQEHDAWFVTDEQILVFVRDHPMAFRLDKVDQHWFMDLITSGNLIRQAIVDEHALAEAV